MPDHFNARLLGFTTEYVLKWSGRLRSWIPPAFLADRTHPLTGILSVFIKYISKLFFLFLLPVFLPALPLHSPTWGFSLDLPEGYVYVDGNNVDRYSFQGPNGALFDIAVYDGVYQDIEQMAADINRRLDNKGDAAFFEYGDKGAVLMSLDFKGLSGWGLCLELAGKPGRPAPLLTALSYAPARQAGMDMYHISALNSFAPSQAEIRLPGPIMAFTFPRGQLKETSLAGTALTAPIAEHDAEAAQELIDREFALMIQYQFTPDWREAWIRFYRAIFRDSWTRIEAAALKLGQSWHNGDKRAFAEKALAWVQEFKYERNLDGSDFVNLVSAISEGRGDCDSNSMLWAIILMKADIPAAIMVSRNHSHAMGLADVPGVGARFEAGGIKWLVAETTVKVGLGAINQEVSDIESWLGILFD